MLIPQYSLRWLLGVTAVCAVVFSIVGAAVQGYVWAAGVAVAIGALVVLVGVYAAMFALVWICSAVLATLRRPGPRGRSPFRQGAARSGGASPFQLRPADDAEIPATPILLE